MRGLWIALMAASVVTASSAFGQPAALRGTCTVLTPPDTGFFLDYSADPPEQDSFSRDRKVGSSNGVLTVADNRAVLYFSAGTAAEATIYLDAESQFHLGSEELSYRQMQVDKGTAVIVYQAREGGPLVIVAGQNWIRLSRGAVVVTVKENSATAYALKDGTEGAVFDGAAPAGDPQAASGGQALTSNAGAAKAAQELMDRLHGQMALEGPTVWLEDAEGGDLTPTEKAGVALGTFETPQVRLQAAAAPMAQISSVASAVATILPPVSAGTLSTSTQTSLVESLLTSQSPGTVLVGDRLGRARTVGIPQPNNLIFNSFVTSPLQLTQRR